MLDDLKRSVSAWFALSDDVGRRLKIYDDLLVRWQATINLVSPATLAQRAFRHFADSLQVGIAAPDARRWVDLGSGGGFPGLVTAITLADQPGARVHLIESDKRKAAFLRTVARETGAPAVVHAERIEHVLAGLTVPVDAVSARALAPLPQLLVLAQTLLEKGAIGVFPQGESGAAELTGIATTRTLAAESIPSRLRDGSRLVIVRAAERTVEDGPAIAGD